MSTTHTIKKKSMELFIKTFIKYVCVCVCVCVCVYNACICEYKRKSECVCVRERESESEKVFAKTQERAQKRWSERQL